MDDRELNAGSVADLQDHCTAVSAVKATFVDIVGSTRPFEEAEDAIKYIRKGKQVGKLVLTL